MAEPTSKQRQQLAGQGKAMAGGRFPIRNRDDLQNAIRAVGRAQGGEEGRRKIRRFIVKRAKALGATNMIPETWRADGSLKN